MNRKREHHIPFRTRSWVDGVVTGSYNLFRRQKFCRRRAGVGVVRAVTVCERDRGRWKGTEAGGRQRRVRHDDTPREANRGALKKELHTSLDRRDNEGQLTSPRALEMVFALGEGEVGDAAEWGGAVAERCRQQLEICAQSSRRITRLAGAGEL